VSGYFTFINLTILNFYYDTEIIDFIKSGVFIALLATTLIIILSISWNVLKRKNTMNIKMLKAALAGLVLSISGFANAGLIININDNGGFAEFSLSGSDVLTSSGLMYNGFWISAGAIPNIWATPGDNAFQITSGFGSHTFGGNNVAINDLWRGHNSGINSYALGLRGGSPNTQLAGTSISISGVFLTNMAFSNFNTGFYTTSLLGPHGSKATLRDGITLNIGNQIQVPEPSTLAIFALGIMGLVSRRFKKKS